eukprot:2715612-Amphidinium_carterae.1
MDGSRRGSIHSVFLGSCQDSPCTVPQARPGSYCVHAHNFFPLQDRPEGSLEAFYCDDLQSSFQVRPETFETTYLFQVRPEQIWNGQTLRLSTTSASCTTLGP